MATGLTGVKHIVAIHSAKGGVGKSTITLNLAVAAAQAGARVGLMDVDIYGPSQALMAGTDARPAYVAEGKKQVFPIEAHGIKFISMGNLTGQKVPVIWRGAMVHGVIHQFCNEVVWGELDYLFIDMPPGTGDAILTIGQSISLSGAVVVTTPQNLSVTDTRRGLQAFHQLGIPVLGILENMSYFVCDGCDDRVQLFGSEGGAQLAHDLGLPLLGQIPVEGDVCDAGDAGNPLLLRQSESTAAKAIRAAADTVLQALAEQGPIAAFDFTWDSDPFAARQARPPQEVEGQGLPVSAVWQVSSDELGIKWATEGSISVLPVRKLRQSCPCAVCVDEYTGEKKLQDDQVPQDISLAKVHSVGRYALALHFSDGHDSGIFRFDRLRALAREREASLRT